MLTIEKVEKLSSESDVEKAMNEKSSDEALVVFHLKNQNRIAYLVDLLTLKDVRHRLNGGLFGIIKIGSNRSDRLELNRVDNIYINNHPFKA